jgi:hypothetical protein
MTLGLCNCGFVLAVFPSLVGVAGRRGLRHEEGRVGRRALVLKIVNDCKLWPTTNSQTFKYKHDRRLDREAGTVLDVVALTKVLNNSHHDIQCLFATLTNGCGLVGVPIHVFGIRPSVRSWTQGDG